MSTRLHLCGWLADDLQRLEQAAAAGRLGHGWLISGPRGAGKANLAYVLAERLLKRRTGSEAPAPASPEQVLAAYAEAKAGVDPHPDLHRIRPLDGKQSIAVEQLREMTAELALTAHAGGAKCVVIEHADWMTTGAANALLKSLEEPIGGTYFLLLAERPGRLPATVRSRCQRLALKLPAPDQTRQWLASSQAPVTDIPPALLAMPPIALASLLCDSDKYRVYNKIKDNLDKLSKGMADPHAIAEAWHKQDTELALSCLIDRLRATIRVVLVPGHTNRITDPPADIMDNCARNSSIGSLFARLRMAENLREQLGRGTNVELALRALLLGLDGTDDQRLEV